MLPINPCTFPNTPYVQPPAVIEEIRVQSPHLPKNEEERERNKRECALFIQNLNQALSRAKAEGKVVVVRDEGICIEEKPKTS